MSAFEVQTTRRRRPRRLLLGAANATVQAIAGLPVLGRLQGRSVCQLRFTGRRSGRRVSLPVMYARTADQVVVVIGDATNKTWWRNFAQRHPVEVRIRRRWYHGLGRVLASGDPGQAAAANSFHQRFPELPIVDDDLFLVITLDTADPAEPHQAGATGNPAADHAA